ncbi:MAG: Foldase protein PrsA [Candidatus Moranbacteria bacterium GW2011_GWE2_35_2-]|nr:MAG: Foldase protein PrsA [Candidatus Moranbacteria bacterium GW2011_GWE2_35_2-]KKQ06625.1 MAG: Foldase protein PrsA [Candidatus Moranbacteria bacterium GW2011_GWF1_36_4]KKQ22787.1 MAG: Foldase protein PrsA [Candidatus Moranbacteria bacterium GW2011_GWF2_37_11]KKQ28798.1 MAG: Foldase protein PrsA [Candidatus Moranbacteria bacterium GW2011_GWD1_37_17]KKQ30982.1 MAG: Foldase protein PrsA [Candidatus Moranbacteria bacterium GW2011_GWE1_37_24]KKQ47036.1 MAG: Foldase protein PrsA [Candidatus Mor
MSRNGKEKKEKKVSWWTAAMSFGVFILFIFVLLSFFIYRNYENSFAKKIVAYIHFPAVAVDYYHFISLSNLNEDLQSVKNFYENQDFSKEGLRVDFSTEDGKKRLKIKEKDILNKLIADKVIELVAEENKIIISKEDVDQNVSRKIEEFGNEEKIKNNLEKLYGWSMEDFKKKIVRPSLYRDEMEKIIQKEYNQKENDKQKDRMQQAWEKLSNGGDFVSIVKEFSQGETAEQGGELGWFSREQILDELAETSFSLKEGGRSGVIESELGYHIIEVEEKKIENDKELIRVRQIFRPKTNLNDWLNEEMKKRKVWIFIDGYFWDLSSGSVEFSDSDLREFEQNEDSFIL